ncbi:hypothetical protein [Legionella clemsonensis]|uniref:Uncharacterized protein n=1 Tax=Legionella clemsonensis TaxID=1867846 RepID=A0A222NZH9_9GAMM|nr:hypothetical protein [Legionella clemsonensis]ASQ44969.1 hypothetical protein clem_02030 [Legionella clemsonensis]
MFFLKKKSKATNSNEFNIFDNKINYISYSSERNFSQRSYEEPYLWTTNLTACVGVGLYYQDEKNAKIELYHSLSEHYLDDINIGEALDNNNDYVSMLFYFLNQLTETSHLKIYVACDPSHSNSERDKRLLFNGINKCINYINKNQLKSLRTINLAQIEAIKVEVGSFFITATGKVGTLEDALSESLDKIQRLFTDESLSNSTLYKEYLILNSKARDEGLDTFKSKKVFFEKLQELASAYLSKHHSSKKKAAEQLAIKLVSWNLFLNGPDNQLFKSWQEKHTKIQYEPPSPYL